MHHDSSSIIEQDPRRKALKDEYIKRRGWWAPFWDDFLALDVEMFEAFLEFGSVAWKKGHLPPKVKEFIYIAIDAATTHMYEPGLRIHLRNAFKLGATKEEIMEVYELVSAQAHAECGGDTNCIAVSTDPAVAPFHSAATDRQSRK